VSQLKPELRKSAHCPLCNAGREAWDLDAETLGSEPYERELFSIYRCRECKIGITDPVPLESDSARLYESRTSSDFQVDDSALADRLKRIAAERDVRTFTVGDGMGRPALKMLDYACGNGTFALSLQRLFPRSSVFATDYHSEAPSKLKGTDIRYLTYGEAPRCGPFDFILCRHVLEHTYHPVGFLRGIGDLMSVGGILMIEVPNLRAPLRKVFGKYWDGYYAPYHPIHFSKAALRRAITDAGLVVERLGGCEMPKIGRSLRNLMHCDYNAALFAAGVVLQPMQLVARFLTGQPTCLRIWARKPEGPQGRWGKD
jgi:SAM-dependent methyltransferase